MARPTAHIEWGVTEDTLRLIQQVQELLHILTVKMKITKEFTHSDVKEKMDRLGEKGAIVEILFEQLDYGVTWRWLRGKPITFYKYPQGNYHLGRNGIVFKDRKDVEEIVWSLAQKEKEVVEERDRRAKELEVLKEGSANKGEEGELDNIAVLLVLSMVVITALVFFILKT